MLDSGEDNNSDNDIIIKKSVKDHEGSLEVCKHEYIR